MADDEDDLEEDAEEGDDEDGEGEPSERIGKQKLFLIIGFVALLAIGGVAGAYFTGFLDPVMEMVTGTESVEKAEGAGEQTTASEGAVFYDLPEILVNLSTSGRKATFLKIRVSLELASADDRSKIEEMMPRIVDNFQVYLRELRIDDLKGSAGMYRLREELLTRVAAAVAPAKVNDVLFKEMLVQ